jgi:hypothetical protein
MSTNKICRTAILAVAPSTDNIAVLQKTLSTNHDRSCSYTPRGSLRGQTLIFLLTMMAILMLMALWLYDMNTCILSRIRSQNAADSSALSAAQWQARSLNAVGEINLVKAIATLIDAPPPGQKLQDQLDGAADDSAVFTIVQTALDNLQVRIQFVGPMMAMVAAQQAAKNNGIPNNSLYTAAVRTHADVVQNNYKDAFTTPEWGDGDWTVAYAKMLNYVADEGVAVAADNVNYYGSALNAGPEAQRWLLDKGFYRAIAIKNWCYLKDIISAYDTYEYWGAISVSQQNTTGNEYFGLGLDFIDSDTLVGPGGLSESQFQKLRTYFESEMTKRNAILHTDWPQFVPPIKWAIYDTDTWTNWTKAYTYEDSLLENPRTQYDYSGCDAVTAVSSTNVIVLALNDRSAGWNSWLVGDDNQKSFKGSVERLQGLEGSNDLDVHANAAAKPFGQLSGVSEPPYTFRMVLPVYDKVRLIPIALASSFGNSDPTWLEHKIDHLALYSQSGPSALPDDCFYCQMLKTWEDASFRQEGIEWLNALDDKGKKLHECLESGGGGGGRGGVPYAH